MTNYAILIGNIATDLELKQAGNNSVLRFNLAVKNPFKKMILTSFLLKHGINKRRSLLIIVAKVASWQ